MSGAANFLTQRRRVFMKTEGTVGTAETITLADLVPRTREVNFGTTPLQVDRPITRPTLTRYPKLVPGQTVVEVTFGVEMGGNVANPQSVYADTPWGKAIRACGYESKGIKQLTIGAITGGPFQHGETVTQSTSGATGAVVGDCFNGYPEIYLNVLSGTFDATNGLTGGSSGATATPTGLNAQTKRAWQLSSDLDTHEAVTILVDMDGKHLVATGCRGNVEFRMTHGGVMLMAYTFRGVLVSYGDATTLTGTLADSQRTPPTFFSPTMVVDNGTIQNTDGPLTQVVFNTGNTVQVRENSRSPNGVDCGVIIGRDATGSFNPDELADADAQYMQDFHSGGVNNVRIETTNAATGGNFVLLTPGLLYTAMPPGDRDNVYILDASFDLTGGNLGLGLAGADNEIVLVNV